MGGESKTLMIVNVSPMQQHVNESLNSLRFAAKVNSCKGFGASANPTNLNSSVGIIGNS
jgi:kinesin family protein C1